jgi:acetate kinase
MESNNCILVINAGSSSIKIRIYDAEATSIVLADMSVDKAGLPGAAFSVTGSGLVERKELLNSESYDDAVLKIIDEIRRSSISKISAIGHRVVHGGNLFVEPTLISEDTIVGLRKLFDIDPDHLPSVVKIIEALLEALPGVPQIACFDTAFYKDLPRVAQIVPIPRKFDEMGIRRYGFHGLSYTYLLEKLSMECGDQAANGRVIFAHLGSGASITATSQSKPLDTTMGLTPASGIPMSTRSGDVDPGVFLQLHKLAGLDYEQINALLSKESGLLGVSETSADMYELLENQANDIRASEAVELFCYEVKKAIGAFATVLGGVDTIVFSGGMGENAPRIRERILRGLEFLGVELHDERNYASEACISSDASRVGVHVFHTDESSVIVRQVKQILQLQVSN